MVAYPLALASAHAVQLRVLDATAVAGVGLARVAVAHAGCGLAV